MNSILRDMKHNGSIPCFMILATCMPVWSLQNNSDLPAAPSFTQQEANRKQKETAKNIAQSKYVGGTVTVAGPKPVAVSSDYVIGQEDVLSIHVWHEQELSSTVPVRPDGKISLPLIGEFQASGLTPVQLQVEIASKLKSFVTDPDVVVVVQQFNSRKFNVLGEVQRPGAFTLATRMSVLDAIAAAGGFKDFAKVGKIYVLRNQPSGGTIRLPFNYKKVVSGQSTDQNVELKPGDTVIVP